MGLKASPEHVNKKDLPPIPGGLNHGICYGVFHIGHQKSFDPKDEPKDKVILVFELPFERIEFVDDNEIKRNLPRAISAKYTRSMHQKSTLRKILTSWRAKAFTEQEADNFDLTSLMGLNGQLNVVHKVGDGKFIGKTFANVEAILPLGKNVESRKSENPHVFFSFTDCKAGEDVIFPKGMPDWCRRLAMASTEYEFLQGEINKKKAESGVTPAAQTVPPVTASQGAGSMSGDPY